MEQKSLAQNSAEQKRLLALAATVEARVKEVAVLTQMLVKEYEERIKNEEDTAND